MAKTSGPLLSNSAWGSIGERLTFSRRKTGQQARFQRAQKDANSADQLVQRVKYSLGLDLWRSLPDVEKGYWKTLANYLDLYLYYIL